MSGRDMSRRRLLAALGASLALPSGLAVAGEVIKDITKLRPGEFTWHPERQRTGPVAVIVSITEQRVHVYRNGIRIAVSTCSTGKPGHETPTGVFVVLQKDKDHKSSTYDDAPMPNMNRLTWSGIALHAGKLPGYPASHGCVRLPFDFSERLFGITHLGTPVIIADAHSDPVELVHPGLVLSGYGEAALASAVGALKGKERPNDWTDLSRQPVVSVIASSADQKILLVENSSIVAEGRLTIGGLGKLGSHVYVLGSADRRTGIRWVTLAHGADPNRALKADAQALARIKADGAFVERMQRSLHPGAMLVLTDLPLSPDSRTGKDFVIMT